MHKGIIVGLAIVFGVVISGICWIKQSIPKTAVVNFEMLYDDFDMRKEYEKEFQSLQTSRTKTLDSIKYALQAISEQTKYNKSQESAFQYERLKSEYLYKQELFSRDIDERMQDYKQKIMKQLKLYIKTYGDHKHYDYILGADEGYTILYTKDNKDITNDLIKYVNQRYKDIN